MLRKPGGTDMGTYRVYKTFHEFDQNGRYRCEFEALPSDLEYLPTPEVPIPTPNPIEVKVWDNEDPKGLGRVRVEFPFDERMCETWIPVMTFDAGSDAGGSGQVKTNRGTIIIPEKGDLCLLHFLDGQHLAHPFIMGSLFHGENASEQGGGKGNHIKSIMTRSNHRIEFNDKEADGWGITVSDRNGNTLHFDTKGKNMTMTAPATLTLNATDIRINASNSIDIRSTGDKHGKGIIRVTAKEDIQTNSQEGDIHTTAERGDITESADRGKFGVSSKETVMKAGRDSTHSSGGVYKITGSSDVIINR